MKKKKKFIIEPVLNLSEVKIFLITLFIIASNILIISPTFGQEAKSDDDFNKGITVSPSNLKYNVDLGKIETKNVKVSNYTDKIQKFNIKYNDFDMTRDGKSSFLEAGSSSYTLSKYLSISPTYIELSPGASVDISLTVQLPNDPIAKKAAWGVLLIEQVEEKKVLDPGNKTENTVALGITPTYAFGIWLYQNPPNVENSSVEIEDFKLEQKENELGKLLLGVKNTGDGISFCKAYIEVTDLTTGEQFQLGGKNYTILPGYKRTFSFEFPENLEKGAYSAVGVIDYKSDKELVAAELNFNIK